MEKCTDLKASLVEVI